MEGEQRYSARDRDENSQRMVETNPPTPTLTHLGQHVPANDECFGAHCEPWSARAMTADSRDPCQPIFSTMKDHPPSSSRQQRRLVLTAYDTMCIGERASGGVIGSLGSTGVWRRMRVHRVETTRSPPCAVSAGRGCRRGARERRASDSSSEVVARQF